ncbi:hypothetical protein Cgig2_021097 [Carnegiea gigantea]|uniref:Uncharacterized protein n=1 Tax=Carnegiea gigantea TaxID=171969 RepID=A0A9Q1QBD6_9CARY|nr:hypothetical protein Cgig2_021097 [Carnegiea gigantea]
MDNGKLPRADFAYFVSIRSSFDCCEDNLDNLLDLKTMLRYHYVLTRYGTGSQVLLPRWCDLPERITTRAFREWWAETFISLTYSPHGSDSEGNQCDLFDTNISKDEGKLVEDCSLEEALKVFCSTNRGRFSRVKIPRIDVAIPATPILAIPIQSIDPLPQVTNEIKEYFESSPAEICRQESKSMINPTVNGQDKLAVEVCEPSVDKVIELPLEGTDNIIDILDAEPNPTKCMGESNDVNFKEGLGHVDKNAARLFGKPIVNKISHTPFDGLPSLKGYFDSLYVAILQRGVDVTPLEN